MTTVFVDEQLIVPVLLGDSRQRPLVETFHPVYNPSQGEVIAYTPLCGPQEVDAAVQAAAAAFPVWSQTPAPQRAEILLRYRMLLEQHADEISRLITRENGKTLDEARGDLRRGMEVVDFALGVAHLSKGESLPQVAQQIDAVTMREPIGVCAGIAPFNFPAMVPMWMYPLAIACGNTFVLKPSEKVPLTAMRLAELFLEAGLPPGVLNVVHGGREVVDALCTHPQIVAVSFVGSSAIARHVYTLASAHGKRVQAGGGAKNVLIVMPDAEPDSTLRAIMGAAFGCAGQRCMAGSLLMGVGEVADSLRERMLAAMEALRIDDTSVNDSAEMGPVIDGAAQARIRSTVERVLHEGPRLVRDGRDRVPDGGFFVGPTLFDEVTPATSIFDQEIFGPVLAMLRPKNLEEAIEWMRRIRYGNGASLFTSSGRHAREFTRHMPAGMLGINVGVPAPVSLFPFAGWNESFYGDLHMQGTEGVQFYTRQKVVLSRWDSAYHRQQGW